MKPVLPSELAESLHVHVHIAGYTVTASELASDVEKARNALKAFEEDGSGTNTTINVEIEDLQTAKIALRDKILSGEIGYPVEHLWYGFVYRLQRTT